MTCYQRHYRAGSLEVKEYRRAPHEYFFEKVDTSGPCWEWTAGVDRDGYGVFTVGPRHSARGTRRAHRWCYEYLTGRTLGGLVLDHMCRNKPCVNPDHLQPMTKEEHDAKTLREVHGIVKTMRADTKGG